MKKEITIIALLSLITTTTALPESACRGKKAYDAFLKNAKSLNENPKKTLKDYRDMLVKTKELSALEKHLKQNGAKLKKNDQEELENSKSMVELSETFYPNILKATKWKVCNDVKELKKEFGTKKAESYLKNKKKQEEKNRNKYIPQKTKGPLSPQEFLEKKFKKRGFGKFINIDQMFPLWEWYLINQNS